MLRAEITEIAAGEVQVTQDGAARSLPCDTVVLAMGMQPESDGLDGLREVAEVQVIGDAVVADDGLKASREGFTCGLAIGR